MATKPSPAAPAPLPYTRVMLLVPNDQASFLDQLAADLSQPGRPATRQDVIRTVLAKLKVETEKGRPTKAARSRR